MGSDPDERQAFHIEDGPGSSFDDKRLDFGHYAGNTIEELARMDPEYLHWLARHPSGSRYRAEIRRVLGVTQSPTDWQR
jgi:hypothetical protein